MPQTTMMAIGVSVALLPLSLYLLIIGLLNAKSHPCLIDRRSDFAVLACIVLPLLLFCWQPLLEPLPLSGRLAAGALLLAIVSLVLPDHHSGWVIFNLTRKQARQLILDMLQGQNIPTNTDGDLVELADRNIHFRLTEFAAMRNVTIRILPALHLAGNPGRRKQYASMVEAMTADLTERLKSAPCNVHAAGLAALTVGVTLLAGICGLLFRHRGEVLTLIKEMLA